MRLQGTFCPNETFTAIFFFDLLKFFVFGILGTNSFFDFVIDTFENVIRVLANTVTFGRSIWATF